MDKKFLQRYIEMGDEHLSAAQRTPIRFDAFTLSDDEKIKLIERNFREIMLTLGLDLNDDSLAGTPHRVAKMYVEELFSGLNPANLPKATQFENKYHYGEMLVERNISIKSLCEHHFVPIVGVAHIAYIPRTNVIGLSKLNRIAQHFARRPQVQERLTTEIAQHLMTALDTPDVAVIIDAKHFCVSMRGVQDDASSTVTAAYLGAFEQPEKRE